MLPSSVDLGLLALLSDGGSAVDEQEAVEWVTEWVESDHLTFLNGWAIAFVVFWMIFLSDTAWLEMVDNFVDPVSAALAMVRNSDNIPSLTQSNL